MNMSQVEQVKFAREAGAVRRLHTHRVIGDADIAQHTFNALSLLRVLYPNARPALIWALLIHDFPERLTGDIPSPVKWNCDFFDPTEYKKCETAILNITGFNIEELTDEEDMILKAVDAIDFYMFCLDQEAMGNSTIKEPKATSAAYIEDMSEVWPETIVTFWDNLKKDNWSMSPEKEML